MRGSSWHGLAAALAAVHAAWGAPALAAQPTYGFSLPPQPTPDALIAIALRTGVSIGGADLCRGRSPGLVGSYTVEAALHRILAGSDCTIQRVDGTTFRVVRAARPAPDSPPRPAPSPPAPPPRVLEPAGRPIEALEEVIITAPRRPTLSDHYAGAVSALSGVALSRAGAADSSDIFGLLAGVSMTNLGPGRDKIMLRGLSDGSFTGRTQSTVGIYLDTAPITYNAPDPNLRLADVDRIEVLRGPQGSLYGGGAISGVFRIAPRQPELNRFGASVLAGVSATQGGAASGEVEAMVNLPLVKDRVALRAVAYTDVQGGYIDDVSLRLSNIDRTTRAGGRVALRTLAGDGWKITAAGAFQRIRANDTQYIVAQMGRFRRSNKVREGHENQFSLGSLNIEGDRGWGHVSLTAALVHNDMATRADATTALPLFGARTPAVGAHDRQVDSNLLSLDVALTSRSGGRSEWLLGAFGLAGREDLNSQVSMNVPLDAPAPIYLEERRDTRSEIALYGEYARVLAAGLKLTVGMRAYSSRVGVKSVVSNFATPNERRFTDHADFGGWMPKVALQFEPSRSVTAYVEASSGRRLGGFNTAGAANQEFLTQDGRPGVYRRFQPDELRNVEVGFKLRSPQRRLRVRAAAFYTDWRNIQTDQYMISGLSYTANAGDGRNRGVEAELAAGPYAGLELQLNGILNSPELNRPSPSFPVPAHIGLPGVPNVSVGGQLSYERPIGDRLSAQFSLQGQYIGHSRPTFDPFAPEMGGYVLSRISASLNAPRWSVRLDLVNPANAAGDTFSYGNPFNFRSTRSMTPQRPRTLRLAVQAAL
jgi:outer membrane receptor protein involved in Fe transport